MKITYTTINRKKAPPTLMGCLQSVWTGGEKDEWRYGVYGELPRRNNISIGIYQWGCENVVCVRVKEFRLSFVMSQETATWLLGRIKSGGCQDICDLLVKEKNDTLSLKIICLNYCKPFRKSPLRRPYGFGVKCHFSLLH